MSEDTGRSVSIPHPAREHESGLLQLRTYHRAGGMVLEAAGDVGAGEAGRFAEVVRSTLLAAVGRVVLDLSGVTLLSTAGVVVLTEACHRADMRSVPLVLVTNNRHVDRVLSSLGLTDLFSYADSLEEALTIAAPYGATRPHIPAPRGRLP